MVVIIFQKFIFENLDFFVYRVVSLSILKLLRYNPTSLLIGLYLTLVACICKVRMSLTRSKGTPIF